CFPIKKLQEILNQELSDIFIGIDYTEAIGAKKYEPPITFKNGETEGLFPSHIIPKTDETRIQNDPDFYINKFWGKPYAITVKLDGTSATFGFDEKFFACSRNLMVREGDNVYWNIAHKYNIPELLEWRPEYVIQGEIVGPGIQKNHLGLNEIDFYVFRVYDRSQKRYLFNNEINVVCGFMGLKQVPVLEMGNNFKDDMDSLLKLAEGKYNGTQNEREGIVVNLEEEDPTQFGGWLSFKVISNRFLIKNSYA
ncbi:MAG TPA: RNA ligase family protein, partial [Massilibacterium sp.]|nr:RNA ligase family protein [Massilibacterium sp.]